jgi:glycosyltransferase involved in cell wall biosynthesis
MSEAVSRILMTADTVGGVWTFALDLAEALGPYGVEVCLAALGGQPSESQRAGAAAIANLQLFTSGYKLEWMEDPWHDVEASGHWVLDLERRLRPSLVHLNSFGHGALPWDAPAILTAHSCVFSWWEAVKGGTPPAPWNRYRIEVEQSLRCVPLVTAPSQTMQRAVERIYGVPPERCRVIPNGRDVRRFHPVEKQPFVLAAGRLWDEAKNIASLRDIAGQVPWPVYVAGDARNPNGTTHDFRGLQMLGQLDQRQLAQWYARAAIFASPARYEPFGLSILEAALSGCALVLGDIESLRENWQDAAIFVKPDDREGSAAALQGLIGDPQLRDSLAARSAERARQFTIERMAAQYFEIYRELADRRSMRCAS